MAVAETVFTVGSLAALVGLGVWAASGGKGKDAGKAASKAEACALGTADGDADGKADAGKVKVQARRALNASPDATIQKEYDRCYDLAFGAVYFPPKTEETGGGGGKKWTPPGPPSGLDDAMHEGETAADYGCRRGRRQGQAQGDAGKDFVAADYLDGGDSIKRQKESGDPPAYRKAYTDCGITAWIAAKTAYDLKKKKEESDEGGGGGFLDTIVDGSGEGRSGRRPQRGVARHGVGGGGVGDSERKLFGWRMPYRPSFAHA